MRVHRAFTYAGVWLVATTAAVTVTWLGVRDVIHGAVFDQPDPPPARPVLTPTTLPPPPPPPVEPAPPPVELPPPDTPTTTAPSPTAPPSTPETTTVDTPTLESTTEIARDVRTYELNGGTVVLSVRPERAELISATPRSGYTVQTWDQAEGWLRVEFSAVDRASTLIATWHDGPTRVETYEN
ncbi:hypothetical protein ABT324_21905 [Saccharopolyspora sp. NPDC000359]|uniref:hypothetical protein n=1 Tax=Saccharopolyspora sp. NPDC000359 TaxID=3154251 RepID=UPI0033342346